MTRHGGNQPVTVGPHELPGYRTFEFTWRGERTPQFEAIFTTFGLHPVRNTGPAFAYLTVIRFDALLALQMTTRPATYAWIRDRPEARRRYGFLLVSQGSVSLTANGATSTATEGGIVAAAPSAGDLTFEAHTQATFVFVSFDANEVRPFSMSGTGTTTVELPKPAFRAVHDYLAEATKSPPSTSPRESEVLRSLTRNVALSLVRAAAPASQYGGLVERASAVIEANAPLSLVHGQRRGPRARRRSPHTRPRVRTRGALDLGQAPVAARATRTPAAHPTPQPFASRHRRAERILVPAGHAACPRPLLRGGTCGDPSQPRSANIWSTRVEDTRAGGEHTGDSRAGDRQAGPT